MIAMLKNSTNPQFDYIIGQEGELELNLIAKFTRGDKMLMTSNLQDINFTYMPQDSIYPDKVIITCKTMNSIYIWERMLNE